MTEDARAYALRLLSQRSYTTRDLRRKLASKEFEPGSIETVVSRLTETGLLDDWKYAINFARGRLVGGTASPRRVQQLLCRKGIPKESALAAVSQTVEEENIDTGAALERVALRKMGSLGDLEPHVIRRRMYGFLARRGHDHDDIRRVVDRLTAEKLNRS